MTRFGTVLVANRGEIACRVIRGAAAMGLRTVAVYSDADQDAPHVREADVGVRIGPAAASTSYLSIPALLDAATRTGADAVHPGYGFLSERSDFAVAVTGADMVFVGPPAHVMELMGRKDRARRLARSAGVPVLPAAEIAENADGSQQAVLDSVAEQVGFPLLVKAAAGGGGKGMRIVTARDDLADAVAAARREAAAAFGDDAMLFERYVEHGRHIEVQIIADEHGHVVHLHERDCSVQRRHQKVLEEAPASVITADVRRLVTSAAVALAEQVGYVNAGTVEFLVAGGEAFFLEMNTRLQVEHPVTELVTGLDLVQLQLLVAQGQELPFSQEQVVVRGHAIEARVYAEDPAHGFLPQSGVARVVAWPRTARVDAALEPGQRVGTSYDPMLGKIIASGATREAARRALVGALDETAILGLATNVGFLRTLVDSAEFRRSEIDTSWLDAHPDVVTVTTPIEAWCLAAWSLVSGVARDSHHPFGTADGWRLGGASAAVPVELTDVTAPEDTRVLMVDMSRGTITGPQRCVEVRAVGGADDPECMAIDGVTVRGRVLVEAHHVVVAYRGQTYRFERPDAFAPGSRAVLSDGAVNAPMPGTVLSVSATVGDVVEAGDTLAVMEAMKMELALQAPVTGRVLDVATAVGDQVQLGQQLFQVQPAGDQPDENDEAR